MEFCTKGIFKKATTLLALDWRMLVIREVRAELKKKGTITTWRYMEKAPTSFYSTKQRKFSSQSMNNSKKRRQGIFDSPHLLEKYQK